MSAHGFVQAGGGSSRFGTDKALVQLGSKTILVRTAELVASVCEDVHVVAPAGKYKDLTLPLLEDRWPGEGPLGGILTALHHLNRAGQSDVPRDTAVRPRCFALIVSCDMPFLDGDFLKFLCDRVLVGSAQVVVPQSTSGLEPLCACWSSDAFEDVQLAFASGIRKVTEAMKRLPTEVLDESAWKRFDKNGRLFWNMNTPQDFDEARRILVSPQP